MAEVILKTVSGSHHKAGKLFSVLTSIITFIFDISIGSFGIFGAEMGYFGEFGYGSKTVLGSTYVIKQLLFSMVL